MYTHGFVKGVYMWKYIFVILLGTISLFALAFSASEHALLKQTSLRCITTDQWPPFNFRQKGELVGIGMDYWRLIKKELGLQGRCTVASSWSQVLQSIKDKNADLTIATKETDKRPYAVFSKPYAHYPIVIVTKNNIGFIDTLDLLKGKVLVLPKEYSSTLVIQEKSPHLPVTIVPTIDDAFKSLLQNKGFATFGVLPVVSYKLSDPRYSTLKISGITPYTLDLSFMLSKKYTSLLPLINRVIEHISKSEKDSISQKWTKPYLVKPNVLERYHTLIMALLVLLLLALAGVYFLKREVAQKHLDTKKLQQMVIRDSLTGIYNRYMFDVSLDNEIKLLERYPQPLSILFYDINDFKRLNDTYGHRTGDKILIELSQLVSSALRENDLFCRWGGDEFCIILYRTSAEHAKKVASSLKDMVSTHLFFDKIPIHISVGIASYKKGDTKLSLMGRADKHLYAEKGKKLGSG